MITPRPSDERGRFDFGWLDTRHTFSFGRYVDRRHMGFRSLRVINEDVVAPGAGFPTHPHDNMEIITYVVSGALEHRDSLGTGQVLRPGEVQRMSAGEGIEHSEFNPSDTEPVHLLQVWIIPRVRGGSAEYDQRPFPPERRRGRLCLVVSPDGAEGSIPIRADARLYATLLEPGEGVTLDLAPGRHAWVQIVRGVGALNERAIRSGDGAAVSDERAITLRAGAPTEALVFELA